MCVATYKKVENHWSKHIDEQFTWLQELCLAEHTETGGDWRKDWNKHVLRALDDDEPCYLLYR